MRTKRLPALPDELNTLPSTNLPTTNLPATKATQNEVTQAEATQGKLASVEPAFDANMLAGQLAPSSIAMYQRDFNAYLGFAGSPAAAVDATTLARWRAHLAQRTDLSPNTINRMISEACVQGFLPPETASAFDNIAGVKTVAMKGRIKGNARVRIEPVTMRTMCDAPEVERLIGLRDTALLAAMASSGLRVSEIATLTVQQIVTKGRGYVVSVRGKNDVAAREAPLSREAHSHIQAWLEAQH